MIDPITLEVVQERLISIVREMRATLARVAYSSVLYEARDFSCVVMNAKGEAVAQSEDNPGHIIPLPWSVRIAIERFAGDIHEGDVILINDPYSGGTHLNDVAVICPVFVGGELVLFPAIRAHWADVGGMTPGSLSGTSTEIFQEGLRIPPIRLYRAGAFRGATESEAFFVRCDESINPRYAVDAGQLVAEIGVAPAEPVEFIVLRLRSRLRFFPMPQQILASGNRVYFVGSLVGAGQNAKLPLAWIDIPTDPLARSLSATTVLDTAGS